MQQPGAVACEGMSVRRERSASSALLTGRVAAMGSVQGCCHVGVLHRARCCRNSVVPRGMRLHWFDVELRCPVRDGGNGSRVADGVAPRVDAALDCSCSEVSAAVLWAETARVHECVPLCVWSDSGMGCRDVLLADAMCVAAVCALPVRVRSVAHLAALFLLQQPGTLVHRRQRCSL